MKIRITSLKRNIGERGGGQGAPGVQSLNPKSFKNLQSGKNHLNNDQRIGQPSWWFFSYTHLCNFRRILNKIYAYQYENARNYINVDPF